MRVDISGRALYAGEANEIPSNLCKRMQRGVIFAWGRRRVSTQGLLVTVSRGPGRPVDRAIVSRDGNPLPRPPFGAIILDYGSHSNDFARAPLLPRPAPPPRMRPRT